VDVNETNHFLADQSFDFRHQQITAGNLIEKWELFVGCVSLAIFPVSFLGILWSTSRSDSIIILGQSSVFFSSGYFDPVRRPVDSLYPSPFIHLI